ncbi:MAG: VanZ family protein [Oscillospiraceae bacterium]|jgi:glycopeptide antibiotics resistance protein|nr:VanZ family protein [Oscillospiraceae bacterium]
MDIFYLLAITLKDSFIGFAVALPFIVVYHALILKNQKQRKTAIPHIIATYIFCFIVSFILSATEIPNIRSIEMIVNIKLTPFTIASITEYLLNILLFIPFGFIAPLLWKKYQNAFFAFLLGLFFSLFIEISQIFNHRVTDIDDLITNIIGSFIGYLIFMLIRLIIPKTTAIFNDYNALKTSKMLVYFVIIVLTSFFIKPFTIP